MTYSKIRPPSSTLRGWPSASAYPDTKHVVASSAPHVDAATAPNSLSSALASRLGYLARVSLVVVWAQPGFSGPVLLFGLNWFGV